MIRAHEITPEFVQVNTRVTAYGEKTLDELFPKVEKAEGEEKKPKERKARK
jgi:small subunit ribosomal protein S6e